MPAIQEIHIGIDLHLQKINSNYIDVILPEEKDFFFNEEQFKYINTRISAISNDKRKGLQFDQKRYDDLEKLITPYSANAFIYNNRSVYINLPKNYLHLVNDRTFLDNLCNKTFSSFTPVTSPLKFVVFKLEDYDLKNLVIKFDGTSVFNLATYPTFSEVVNEESFSVNNLILYHLNIKYEVYWQYFNGVYYGNQFILVSNSIEAVTITYPEVTPDEVIRTFDYDQINKQIYNSTSVKEIPNRLTKTEDIYEILRGSFTKTDPESPVSEIKQGQLIVFHDEYFISTKISIDYIRKPQPVSLSLNQNCELDENIHNELIAGTAKTIAAFIESSTYTQISNENLTKE